MRTLRAIGSAFGLIFVYAGGCRQIVGVEERATQCGALAFTEPSCAKCIDGACCAEETACSKDAACQAAADRLDRCAAGDAACRIAATPAVANGTFTALEDCREKSCALACNTCGGLVDHFGASCDACVLENCCDLGTACVGDASCAETFACVAACTGLPDCPAGCVNGPTRDASVSALQNCMVNSCTTECAVGRDWKCARDYSWGSASTTPSIAFDVKLINILTQVPVPDATVTLCHTVVGDCFQTATSNADGIASFDVPVNPPLPFLGYAKLSKSGFRSMLAVSTKAFFSAGSATFYMVTDGDFQTLTTQFKVPIDPTRALVFVTALDCNGFNAPDITFKLSSNDPSILTSYFQGVGVDPTLLKTNKSGTAAFGNVPVDAQKIVGVSMFLDTLLLGGSLVPIDADTITELQLFPSTS